MSQPEDVDNPGDQPNRRGQPAWRRLAAPLRARLTFGGATRHLRAIGPVLAIAVILAGFGIAFASQSLRAPLTKAANGDATATASLGPSDTATTGEIATATPSSAPATATPGSSGPANPPGPTAPPDSTVTGFHIKSATVTAGANDNFSHTCAATVYETFALTFMADINSTGETVTYGWYDLGPSISDSLSQTVTFAPGEMSKSVTFQMAFGAALGDGAPQQDNVWVKYDDETLYDPLNVTHATVAFTCVRHLTNLTFTPSLSVWNAPCATSTLITFTWTVSASPGPQMDVVFSPPTQSNPSFSMWLAPNGFGATIPATQSPDETSSSATGYIHDGLTNDSLLTSPDGDRWMQVATTSPEVLTARATVTKSCGTATPPQ